ncbi:MAG: AAA family ATPase [Thermaerobacter sp.]|nr:hypothetical protein [Bacillota bacterium]
MNLWDGEHQASSLERMLRARRRSRSGAAVLPRVLVTAGGAGAGRTTLAVNLAVALQERGSRVLLVDADPQAGVEALCGLGPAGDTAGGSSGMARHRRDADPVVQAGPAGILRAAAPAAGSGGAEPLLDCLLQALPPGTARPTHVVVDLPAGLVRDVRPWLEAASGILLVAAPDPAAITGAYAVLKVSSRANPAAGLYLVVNRAEGTEARRVFRRLDAAAVRFLGVQAAFGGALPEDPAVRRAASRQVPFVVSDPGAPASVAVRRVARRVARALAAPRPAPVSTSEMTGTRRRGAVP